ncbi:TetR/AcrR family transcriptional regulator [Phytohabitans flavus]|uniref:TetR family transcriptional regulator n=1 Tax=Phytohabitans flavus TaxID=1076124 RepID=A0A6F8XL27_9ACTN|nr:TetR/AcrR family transcriptional regulator [Phytohabitans flavus]BCB74524.1 TetR family transcriptional regulator [Phytohabitans flavus]
MTRSPVLRDHIAAGMLDVAAALLAERGEQASMTDIAEAAGVSRATLYRYFPNRQALLRALTEVAFADLSSRIADAKVDTVPIDEAIARLTRAMLAATSKYRALTLFEKSPSDLAEADQVLIEPIRTLFRRGDAEQAFRADLPIETLVEIYIGLLEATVRRVLRGRFGVEEASAAMTGVFLRGARRPASAG